MKRALDLVLSVGGLVVLWPAFAVIAILIRLDSPGPVFFRQERVGLRGTTFRIHKFRTLRVAPGSALISPTGDPRITRVGALLRRNKLDELPQLIDVMTGAMSLVGPRPEVPYYVAKWPGEWRDIILSVRPGITDPASIALRHEADELAGARDPEAHYVDVLLPRKTAVYVEYVRNRSLVGDIRIIVRTLASVLV